MQAAWYDSPGPADEVLSVGEMAVPTPGVNEVLIRVCASGINPSDVKRRSGWTNAIRSPAPRRLVPHMDGAGVVEGVGMGVKESLVGRRVWIWNAAGASLYGSEGAIEIGTAAEYIAIPQAFVVPLPDNVSFEEGACLGGKAFTAHALIFADGDVLGQTILVQGAAGAVGELAVQFAAAGGARVIATVSSEAAASRASAAGAAATVNRKTENVIERVLALAPEGVDRIVEVDFAANINSDIAMIRPNGTISSYSSTSNREPVLPYYGLQLKGITVHFLQAYILSSSARERATRAITRKLAEGRLRPTVAHRFPLKEIAAAHNLMERGLASGNVVLTL
jgi:NADPH:quinone reductase